MRVPDLEADIEYQEDLDYLYSRTVLVLDTEKMVAFWKSLTIEKLHETAMRAREYHALELIQKEANTRDERRKASERETIISLGIGSERKRTRS